MSEHQDKIFLHLPEALEAAIALPAAEEMKLRFAESGAGLSMIAYLDGGAPPEGMSRPCFTPGPAVSALLWAIEEIFEAQLPEACAGQHEGGGRRTFTTLTVNRNWATPLHRDSGTRPGSIVALAIVKLGAVTCPTRFLGTLPVPEASSQEEDIELESGDLVLFQGAEIEHGNPQEPQGSGERYAFVFYAK